MKTVNREKFIEILEGSTAGIQYLDLIEQVQYVNRGLSAEKGFELHHIHPRALGGEVKDEENIIKLTVLEHCISHALLAQAFPCQETLTPIVKMSGGQVKKLAEVEKLTLYDFYNWKELKERGREQSAIKLKELWRDPDYRKRWTESRKKIWTSEELRQRQRNSHHHLFKGHKILHLPKLKGKHVRVPGEEVEKYIEEGYVPGWSQEYKDSRKGREAPNKGKHHSEQTKAKISEANKGKERPDLAGKVAWNRGIGRSEQSIQLQKESLKNRWKDPEFREKMRKAKQGKKHKPHGKSTREKIGVQSKGRVSIHLGNIRKRVKPENLKQWLQQGYVTGWPSSK